jgi:lysine 2,3-aminomutase
VEKITDDEVIFRNYEGQRFTYPLKSAPRKTPDGAPMTVDGFEKIVVH